MADPNVTFEIGNLQLPALYRNQAIGDTFSKGYIWDGYLYVCIKGSSLSQSTNNYIYLFKHPLYDLRAPWELVTQYYIGYVYNAKVGFASGKLYLSSAHWWGNGNTSNVWTSLIFDLTNPGLGWLDSGFTDQSSALGATARYGGELIATNEYLLQMGQCYQVQAAYTVSKGFKISRGDLTGSFNLTSAAPRYYNRNTFAVYNDEVYVISGLVSDGSQNGSIDVYGGTYPFRSTGGYLSSKSMKYNTTTDSWTDDVLPTVPYPFLGQSCIAQANNLVFIINKTYGMCHYCDLSLGKLGSWVPFQIPPFGLNENSPVTYDPIYKRLLALDTDGKLHYLKLGADLKPVQSAKWDDSNQGFVETIILDTPNADFTITTKSQTSFAVASTIGFTIGSYGWRITSMTSDNTPNPSFTITSYSTGTVQQYVDTNIIGTADDIAFTYDCVASETGKTNEVGFNNPTISFTIGSKGGGFSDVVGIYANTSFKLNSYASGFINSSALSVTDIQVLDLTSYATGEMPVADWTTSFVGFTITSNSFGVVTQDGVVQYPPATVDAVCVNVRTNGHSQFTNYPFNSMFKLNGEYFGTSNRGLFKLSGTTDNGVAIEPVVSTGLTDFVTAKRKNIANTYIHARTNGDVIMQLNTDEQINRRGYRVTHDDMEGLHRRRIRSAKGIKGTNWQIQLTTTGTEFEVNQIESDVSVLGRIV